jgi:hypothetical protein
MSVRPVPASVVALVMTLLVVVPVPVDAASSGPPRSVDHPAVAVAPDAPGRRAGHSVRLQVPARAMVGQPVRMVTRSRPVRPGRPVRLQRMTEAGWRTTATVRQSRTGRAEVVTRLTGAPRTATRWRAVVPRWRGSPRTVSAIARVSIGPERTVVADRVRAIAHRDAVHLVPGYNLGEHRIARLSFERSSATAGLDHIGRGDVLSIPPTAAIPHGALLEVVARSVGPGGTELQVVLASLSDVVVNVPRDATDVGLRQVGPVRVSALHEGVASTASGEAARVVVDVDSGPDLDGGRPGLRTRGAVVLRPVARLRYDVDWGRVTGYGLAFGWDLDEQLRSTMRPAFAPFDVPGGEWPLFRADATFRGAIGRLPVWLSVTAEFRLELAPHDKPTITVEWTRRGLLAGAVRSRADPRRVALDTVAPSGEVDVRTALDGRAGGTMRTYASASLYSARGPQLDGHRAVDVLTNRAPGQQCLVQDDPGVSMGVGGADLLPTLLRGAETIPGGVGAPTPEPAVRPCPDAPRIAIITSDLPEVVLGEEYATALEVADHRPGTWTLVRGLLPAGLTLAGDGRISGTHTGPTGQRDLEVAFTDANGTVVTQDLTLAVVDARTGSRWRSIDGGATSCGIRTDDTLWCWGRNEHGQVGDGTTIDRPAPVQVPGAWASVAAGPTSCAVRTDATAFCWGENFHGQVGDGTTRDRAVPVQLPGLWRTVTPGPTTCGVRVDASGWCWGENSLGQVGDGSAVERHVPAPVEGSWRHLVPGLRSCGVRTDASAWCWGAGHVTRDAGIAVGSPLVRLHGSWATLVEPSLGCGLLDDGRGWCEPSWHVGGGPTELDGTLTSVVSVLGTWCAVRSDSSGWCWGENRYGQVGDGDSSLHSPPYQLDGTWRTMSTGIRSCGLRTDDTAWCWGFNRYGGVSDGTTSRSRPPTRLAGTWRSVSGACGIRDDGTGWCWGTTGLGPVAEDTTSHRTTPVQLP